MRLLKYLLLLLPLLGLGSCDWNPYSGEVGHSYTPWIATMNLDGSNVQYIHQGYGNSFFCHDPLYNRERILTINADSLYIMDVDGGNLEVLMNNSNGSFGSDLARFNNNQNTVVLYNDGDIYTYCLLNRAITQITRDISREHSPAISPNGNIIAYVSVGRPNSQDCIAYRNIYDLSQEHIIASGQWLESPVFLDDRQIACRINGNIAIVDIITHNLTNQLLNAECFRMDSCLAMFCVYTNNQLYLYNDSGIEQVNLPSIQVSTLSPTFSNSGNYIIAGRYLYSISSATVTDTGMEPNTWSFSSMNADDSKIVMCLTRVQ